MAHVLCSAASFALLLAFIAAVSPALGRSLQADMAWDMMAPTPSESMGPMEGPLGAPGSAPADPVIVDWTFAAPGASELPPVTVKVGDSVEFVWSDAVHGVFKIPDGTCPDSFAVGGDMVLVGEVGTEGSYAISFEAPGTFWFACNVGTHCKDGGMLMKVTVTP